ncbi:HEAT repeat domain-containing protein, partial [candidate division KSB1 bacterium]
IGRMWAGSELARYDGISHVKETLAFSALNDSFWAVRRSSLEALSKFNVKMDTELLKELCEDENSNVRTSAMKILGNTGDPALIPFLIDQFSKDDSYVAQAEILRSIGKCGDRTQISFLKDVSTMESPRDVIKRAAEWAINELNKNK